MDDKAGGIRGEVDRVVEAMRREPYRGGISGYQTEVARTASHSRQGVRDEAWRNREFSLCGMGLSGEAGEVTDLLKKVVHHGRPFDAELRAKLIKEMGDALWYVTHLATLLDTTLDEVATANVEKLRVRYPLGFTTEDSIARRDELPAGGPAVSPLVVGSDPAEWMVEPVDPSKQGRTIEEHQAAVIAHLSSARGPHLGMTRPEPVMPTPREERARRIEEAAADLIATYSRTVEATSEEIMDATEALRDALEPSR